MSDITLTASEESGISVNRIEDGMSTIPLEALISIIVAIEGWLTCFYIPGRTNFC